MGKKKTAVVIGASGLVGNALVRQLLHATHIDSVVALTRSPLSLSDEKLVNKVIDFAALEDHAECFQADILFSCLGTTRKQAGSVAAQRVVDVEYQYQAAKLARQQGVKHYLLVSSSGANAASGNAYMQMKGELEDRVKDLAFPRTSILQPSLLLGARNHFRLGEVLGSWVLPLLCKLPGLQRYRPILGQEVAEKMLQLSQVQWQGVEYFVLDQVFP